VRRKKQKHRHSDGTKRARAPLETHWGGGGKKSPRGEKGEIINGEKKVKNPRKGDSGPGPQEKEILRTLQKNAIPRRRKKRLSLLNEKWGKTRLGGGQWEKKGKKKKNKKTSCKTRRRPRKIKKRSQKNNQNEVKAEKKKGKQ